MPPKDGYDIPEWRSEVNFEMPEGSNVHVITKDTAGVVGVGKAKPKEGGDVAFTIKNGVVTAKNCNERVEYSVVVTLPEVARCKNAEGGDWGMTWYTTDSDNEMVDIFTFVIHLPPLTYIKPFTVSEKHTMTSLRRKGAGWAAIPNTPHPCPLPDTPFLLIGFPITGPPDQAWRCGQGFSGGLTHYGDVNCHSVDFECEEGTSVTAVLPGIVTAAEDSHEGSGGHIMHLFSGYNQVIVAHEDGTEACYLHLLKDSILVSVGQHVKKGQHLASTGSVGFAPWPHIHFQLNKSSTTANKDEVGASVPFVFESTNKPFVPVAGYDYTTNGRVMS